MFRLVREFLRNEDGFLGALGGAILGKVFGGSAIAKAAGTAVGGFLGNKFAAKQGGKLDRSLATQDYYRMRRLGFTHSEIAGAGDAGAGNAQQAIMGNQHTAMMQMEKQQQYEAEQRNLDRAVQMRAQDMGLAGSQTMAGAQMYGANIQQQIAQARLALDQERFQKIDLPIGLNNAITSTPAWRRTEIVAQMGVNNVIGTAISNEFGIDPFDKKALAAMSQKEFAEFITLIYGMQSGAFSTLAGGVVAGNVLGAGLPKPNLTFGLGNGAGTPRPTSGPMSNEYWQ